MSYQQGSRIFEQRKRSLRYKMQDIKRGHNIFNRQRKLLPIIILCGLFTILFWLMPKLQGSAQLTTKTEVKFNDENLKVVVRKPGIFKFKETFKFLPSPNRKGKKIADVEKLEYFIQKNGKTLYHFYIDNSLNTKIEAEFNYKFRSIGEYSILRKLATSDGTTDWLTSDKAYFTATSGNTSVYNYGFWIFLISGTLLLVLQDYFGKISNYPIIWNEKKMIFKSKEFGIVLVIGALFFALGFSIASTGYGYAGYSDDMHAPADNLKTINTYYVN